VLALFSRVMGHEQKGLAGACEITGFLLLRLRFGNGALPPHLEEFFGGR